MTEKPGENLHRTSGSKELLLSAAGRLFTEKGYRSVSTRELADAAGVNLAAIQYHFGSKAKLFIEAVGNMMDCSVGLTERLFCHRNISGRLEAAEQLALFVGNFLRYLVRPTGPQPCRLMFREILSDQASDPELFEAIVAAGVSTFHGPLREKLLEAIQLLLPNADRRSLELNAESIIGLCSYYVSHQPFIERIRGGSFSEIGIFTETAQHIVTFSLSALGCEPDMINQILTAPPFQNFLAETATTDILK